MPKVSVVVTTSNAKNALLATTESILDQGYSDLELFISDDGSVDESGLEFLLRFGPDSARAGQVWQDSLREDAGTRSIQLIRGGVPVHYLHQVSPRGPSAARNRALNLASGELLAFAEAGDVWRPWKLTTQVELLEGHSEYGACLESPSPKKAKRTGPRKLPALSPVSFEEILLSPNLGTNGALVCRTCMGFEAPFDENLPICGDYDFWLRLASHHEVARVAEPMQISSPRPERTEWGLERFRVYALEKAYQGGNLNSTLRHRVAEELVHQCNLLVEGYRQRNNQERANFYDRKKKRFAQEVTKLDLSDPAFSGARIARRSLTGAPA